MCESGIWDKLRGGDYGLSDVTDLYRFRFGVILIHMGLYSVYRTMGSLIVKGGSVFDRKKTFYDNNVFSLRSLK